MNDQHPVIGDDAEAAIVAERRAKADLTAALVALVARHSSGDPEDPYMAFMDDAANEAEIDLGAALDQAAEAGFLNDIDRPGEDRAARVDRQTVATMTARAVAELLSRAVESDGDTAGDSADLDYAHDLLNALDEELFEHRSLARSLDGTDRPAEEVRREPTVLLSSAEMIRRARVAGMREVADVLDAESAGAPRLMASSRIVQYIRARADRVETEGEIRPLLAADRAAAPTDLRRAFVAGAQWADDQCPTHAYPKLVEAEAEKRYPEGRS